METTLVHQNEALQLSQGTAVLFNVTDNYYAQVIRAAVNPNSPKELNVFYSTVDSNPIGSTTKYKYTIAVYEGLDNPVGRTPAETFTVQPSDNGQVTINSKFNFKSGQFIIGLSVSINHVPQTLCSYLKLINGKDGANFHESIEVLAISANNMGFELEIQSSALSGINPKQNGDSIFLFQTTPEYKQIKGVRVQSTTNNAITLLTTDELNEGGQYMVGYYCGNWQGACSSKQKFIINNIG
ncbi:conserved hypothetical protein [Tenacibaculum litopenaei]|uniref:hypothetical protein n=1 Tax=Tenacibaculum litopenaei TaxID=396016 RepID=UPI0038953BED